VAFGDFLSANCALDHFMFTFLRWFLFRLDYAFFEFAFFSHLVVPALPAHPIIRFVFVLRYRFSADFATKFFFFLLRLGFFSRFNSNLLQVNPTLSDLINETDRSDLESLAN